MDGGCLVPGRSCQVLIRGWWVGCGWEKGIWDGVQGKGRSPFLARYGEEGGPGRRTREIVGLGKALEAMW